MFAVATWTAGRRITGNHTWWWAAVPIGVAVFPVVLLLVAIGLLPVRGIALIPVTGILIGEIAWPSAAGALIPALDQTRTVGLVTLPGAFIGMLLGGASPLPAGAVQLFVLVALLAVEAVAIAVVLEMVARDKMSKQTRGT
ncbi:ABC transporter permease [Streptomyces sp. NPDC056296]|uniref:ABC transporter permease n=1 Tax=Streptomyces sp. NPDC056296 TaxID=3345775 RepID=UPI0035D603BC